MTIEQRIALYDFAKTRGIYGITAEDVVAQLGWGRSTAEAVITQVSNGGRLIRASGRRRGLCCIWVAVAHNTEYDGSAEDDDADDT